MLRRLPSPSQTKDGRNGLFGVLQYTEAGNPEVDSWMGHPLVNPKKGKLGLSAPTDATGETLSVVLLLHIVRVEVCMHRAKVSKVVAILECCMLCSRT